TFDFCEASLELRRFVRFKLGDDGPILFRHECLNFVFALHNYPKRNRLNTSCGDTAANFVPKQRADLIADQPVENTPGLLRVYNVLINAPRMFYGGSNRLGCDLIKEHAKDFSFVAVEDFFQMLANRFAFAIRVGREEYALSC